MKWKGYIDEFDENIFNKRKGNFLFLENVDGNFNLIVLAFC